MRVPRSATVRKAEHITFGCAVIATGAPPFVPPIPGAREAQEKGGVLTSDTVWTLSKPPKSMVIVGAGAIGVEMAQIFQDFGTKVTLLEAQQRILAEVEPEVAKALTEILATEPNLDGRNLGQGREDQRQARCDEARLHRCRWREAKRFRASTCSWPPASVRNSRR